MKNRVFRETEVLTVHHLIHFPVNGATKSGSKIFSFNSLSKPFVFAPRQKMK